MRCGFRRKPPVEVGVVVWGESDEASPACAGRWAVCWAPEPAARRVETRSRPARREIRSARSASRQVAER